MTKAGRTVLIVDDELDIREMIELKLRFDGFRVLTAEEGERGIQIAEEQELDLIITDLKMPGMGGLEFLERIRTLAPEVAVIVVTGYLSPDAISRSRELGAREIIRKPFTIQEFEKAVGRYLVPSGP